MSVVEFDTADWRAILDQLDEPAVGAVAEAVSGARDIDTDRAYDAVESAIDDGPLEEADTGGAFPAVRVVDAEQYVPDSDAPTPLEQYVADGPAYPVDDESEGHYRARDAGSWFTASSYGPPFGTSLEDAGDWGQPGYRCACDATENAIVGALLETEHTDDWSDDDTDETPEMPKTGDIDTRGGRSEADESGGETRQDGDAPSKYRRVYLDAADRAGREPWEPVEESAIREALSAIGFEQLLDNGALFKIGDWNVVDVSDDGEDPRRRWYYPRGDEPDAAEFRRFDELLTEAAPDDYVPHYFRVASASKDPATQFGSWKTDDARLSVEEAVDWMDSGGNVGIAGRGGCRVCGGDGVDDDSECVTCGGSGEDPEYDGPLVNVDIDDDEATTPDDVPTSLRARSRSRTGWHTWYFNPDGDIPNIPTDEYGEVRANWQYVVAPGSFVASTSEEIPDGADRPGYYTVEDEESVPEVGYDELPAVFREVAETIAEADEEDDSDELADPDSGSREYDNDGGSDVYDVEATDLISGSKDETARFSSVFHSSSTGANMSVSGDKVHCWRHGVAHGGLQALATLSSVEHVRSYGCRDLGAEHKNSGAGSNRLKGDWQLVWGAWYEAKSRGHIGDDDPIPYRVLRELSVADGVVDSEDILLRDANTGAIVDDDSGDTYRALPAGTYNDALEHVRERYDVDPGREPISGRVESSVEESDRDLLELEVVVEPAEAMRAARAVEPDDLERDLPELERDGIDDVAIAVALADGLIDDPETFPRDDGYTESYYRARDVFGAPLPEYLDNSTLAERFDLISAAVARVGPEHILDELESEIITEDPSGEAIANIDPVWEETEGSGRIVAGYGAGFWCAEHDDVGSFSPLQVVALEHGIIDDESEYPTGQGYKRAYQLLREEYGAPLPRWRATILEEVTVLPPAIRVRNDELSASPSAVDLEDARERTEALVRDALSIRDRAQLVTVVPGGGKTYSTAIAADDEPVLYAPPRNELKQQMEEYAAEVSESDTIDAEPSAYHLPILAERQLDDEALDAGVGAVRDQGAGLLRDRDALLEAVEPHIDGSGDSEADGDDGSEDDDDIDLERAVCPTADGEHGEEWRVALQVARARGFDPAVLHQQARTLFGEELPCEHAGECEYTAGWDAARDPESCPDILIGSPGHAFVDSATSYYSEDGDGYRTTEPRAVVIDEFPGDTYANEYGSRYMDHAVWLGEALVGVESREELLAAGLDSDTWVRKWISGDAGDVVDAGEAIDALRAGSDIVGAVESAEQLLESEPVSDRFNITETLEAFVESDPESVSPDTVADAAGRAAELVKEEADRAYATDDSSAGELYDLVETLEDDIAAPLLSAAAEIEDSSLSDAIDERTAGLPIAGDLRRLVDDAAAAAVGDAPPELLKAATEALRGGRDGCRALAVAAEDGYAHPDAWALLAGAIADPEEAGVTLGSQRTLSFGEGEGMQHKNLTANGADIHADRDHHGAVVFDRPAFTSADGDKCALVGLDATARRDLWRIALGRDAEVRDIHDTVAERRRHIRDGMSHTVVQTANTPLPYHGDPSGRNFQEDLGVVEAAAEEYVGPDGIDDKDPAVISTLKVLDYLSDELEDLADETVNYENMLGSDALGDHQVAVILGSQHFGDTEPERWAMYGSESADRGDTSGPTLDYDSDVANTYLKHMREDATMQAILRAGRNDDSSVVVAHTSALRDDVPVVAEGATVSAHSKGALAVADAAAGLNGRTFTAADVAERVATDDRGVGLRQVQNILADLRSSGYLQVEERGSRGRQYEYDLEEDPGLADTELPDAEVVDGASAVNSKTKNELLDTYSWNFVLDSDANLGEGMLPPPRATIPASDTAATLADGVEPPS